MVITYLGEGSFRIQSGERSLLIDPVGNRFKGDATIKTSAPANDFSTGPDVVAFPGEYEIQGIEIEGYQMEQESTDKETKTVYRVIWEDVRIFILGGIAGIPDPKILDHGSELDVLILPVNSEHFLTPEDATKLIKQLEPATVIPSLWDKANLTALAKELGQETDPVEKFVFKKKELTPAQMRLVALGPKE